MSRTSGGSHNGRDTAEFLAPNTSEDVLVVALNRERGTVRELRAAIESLVTLVHQEYHHRVEDASRWGQCRRPVCRRARRLLEAGVDGPR